MAEEKNRLMRCQMLSCAGSGRALATPRRFATSSRTEPVPFGPLSVTRPQVRPVYPKRVLPKASVGRLAVSYMTAAAAPCASLFFLRMAWPLARSPLLKNAIVGLVAVCGLVF